MKHFIVAFLCLTVMCAAESTRANRALVIKGSDTLGSNLVPALVDEFRKNRPDTQFQLVADGSTHGIEALLQGTTDLAMSSRRALPQEYAVASARGVVLRPIPVCWDGIAIIVNERLPVEDLSLQQLRHLFTGQVRNWEELGVSGGRVNLYTRTPSSGTYLDFKIIVMNRREYSRSIRMQLRNQQIASAVARDPNGIGYVGTAFTNEPGIKVLKVEGVFPIVETVLDKSYLISRPNFFYTDGQSTGPLAEFIDFVLSEQGQSVISDQGFVPPHPEP